MSIFCQSIVFTNNIQVREQLTENEKTILCINSFEILYIHYIQNYHLLMHITHCVCNNLRFSVATITLKNHVEKYYIVSKSLGKNCQKPQSVWSRFVFSSFYKLFKLYMFRSSVLSENYFILLFVVLMPSNVNYNAKMFQSAKMMLWCYLLRNIIVFTWSNTTQIF